MYSKYFLNLNIQKVLKFRAKLNSKFLSTGPASEAEIKKTAEFYERIATKYFASNDLITLGLHRSWRRALADNIEIYHAVKILDAPAGTGLNTLEVLKKSKRFRAESGFLITMFDINPHMMKVGSDNFKRLGYDENLVNYVEGNLHKLPFDDGSFHTVITSLANRPYLDFTLVLKEIHRVLKSHGKIVMMDYCFPENPTIIQRLYCNYIEFIASKIERKFLGDDYGVAEFVTKSIRDVIGKENVRKMLIEADFQIYEVKKLSLGIAELIIAFKR